MATTSKPIEKAQKTSEKDDASARKLRREKRRKKIEKATTVTFSLQPEVRAFLTDQAKDAGMDLSFFMQKLVDDHLVATAPEDNPMSIRIQARRGVLDHVVDLARQMDARGEFSDDFILRVIQAASEDPDFMEMHRIAVTEDPENERRNARARASLNQQIGRLIKRAAGARSKRDDNKKIMRGQAQDGILTSFTLLDKAA